MNSSRLREAYSTPDVALFGASGRIESARSLPPGERVSLPYFGRAPVEALDTGRSGKAYARSRSRSDREDDRSGRMGTGRSSQLSGGRQHRRDHKYAGGETAGASYNAMGHARHSSRSQSSVGFNSARINEIAEARPVGDSSRRRSTWSTKRATDFKVEPRFGTRSQLLAYRRAAMLPHYSFDVDGDGVVSSEDFALAQAFDVNKDGVLDDGERHELRKEMVATLIARYRRLPHSNSEASEALIRKFTKDIDATVEATNFTQEYNKLHRQTMVNNTTDSTHMHEAIQPIVVAKRGRIAEAFKEFDVNGDGVISHEEFSNGVRNLAHLPEHAIAELITIVDKDNDGEIDYLEFAKQCTDPGSGRAKQVLEDVTKRMTSARSDEGELDKVETFRDGANGGRMARDRFEGRSIAGSGFAPRKYSGYKTNTALKKAAATNYKRFAERQLKENLKPILTIF